jgi:hypothetical protein
MLADPVDPIADVEGAVALIRKADDRQARRLLVFELLRGQLDYGSPEGRAIGHRRAHLCTRLREEELDDVFL